jgi:hypothetical protein
MGIFFVLANRQARKLIEISEAPSLGALGQ